MVIYLLTEPTLYLSAVVGFVPFAIIHSAYYFPIMTMPLVFLTLAAIFMVSPAVG